MLSQAEVEHYFKRIHYTSGTQPCLSTLQALHKAHMQHIAFENLNIHLALAIDLNISALFNKIIMGNRGGFCYELNHLFFALLRTLGFETSIISGRVFNGEYYGPEFDHLLLSVTLPEGVLIADIGFGDSSQLPLFINGAASTDLNAVYSIQRNQHSFTVMQQKNHQENHPQFQFSLQPYQIDDFAPMCAYQQSSPHSHFTQKSVCSIATALGRNTLSNGYFIQTISGKRSMQQLSSASQYRSILKQHFEMALPETLDITALLSSKHSHKKLQPSKL